MCFGEVRAPRRPCRVAVVWYCPHLCAQTVRQVRLTVWLGLPGCRCGSLAVIVDVLQEGAKADVAQELDAKGCDAVRVHGQLQLRHGRVKLRQDGPSHTMADGAA